MFISLPPHGLQHARLPCPSPTPGACSNSCPSSWWFHPTTLSSVIPFSSCLRSFPASQSSNESVLHIRWPKYWSFSFSISPFNEHPGLISFRMDWLDLLAVQGTLKESSPTPQFKSISSLVLSFLYSPTFTSIPLEVEMATHSVFFPGKIPWTEQTGGLHPMGSQKSQTWLSDWHTHLCIITGKTIALVGWTFVGKVMSLLFNMLSRLVIAFLSRHKRLLISWLKSPPAVILEPPK